MSDTKNTISDTMNTQEAARYYNVSERTILRRIKEGKVQAERAQGRWVIRRNGQDVRHHEHNPPSAEHKQLVEQLKSENEHLREMLTRHDEQLVRRDEQIESLAQEMDHLTQLLAVQTKTNAALTDRLQVIEDMRGQSWWRRVFRQKL